MSINLANVAREKGIRYFLISFTDLFGVVRSKLVPTSAISGMQKDGAGFAELCYTRSSVQASR